MAIILKYEFLSTLNSMIVKFHQIDKFDEIIMESLNDHIFSMNNATLPLWKINVFEEMRPNGNQFISVSFDHSNYDGLSGVQFQKIWLRNCQLPKMICFMMFYLIINVILEIYLQNFTSSG